MKASTALQGVGVSALVLFPFYRSMLDMPGDIRMHAPVSAASLIFPLIANLLIVSVLFTLLAAWLHKTSRWTWWKLFLPALIWASLAEMIHIARSGWVSTAIWGIVLVAVLSLTAVLRWRWPKGEKILLQLSGAVLIGLGFFCFFVVVQLLFLSTWRQSPNTLSESIQAPTIHSDRPRVVWILFDALSYDQVFEHRYPGLLLPNFDKLRQSSTIFSDVQPVANETEKAVPSILLGQRVERVQYTRHNRLKVGGTTGAMRPFDAARTPFAAARRNGLTTGVVGWYNPYCSILSPYLNQCYWTDTLFQPGRSTWEAYWHNFRRPWALYGMILAHPLQMRSRSHRVDIYRKIVFPPYLAEILNTRYAVANYLNLMHQVEHILEPSGPDFVFLHLPLPHLPGFYNRETQQFDPSGRRSYIDNLALADKALGRLLAILEQSPRWKDTSVVICGDHSWRVFLWAGSNDWTAEDQAASHGAVFDPRPMLMVHLAGQTTAGTVNTPFPLLGVHAILNDLVEDKRPSFSRASLPPVSASLREDSPASSNKIADSSGIR